MKLIISDGKENEEIIDFVLLPETFDKVFDIIIKGESIKVENPKNCYPEKCTPQADNRTCKMRSVLDGEMWCETHQCYQYRSWQW